LQLEKLRPSHGAVQQQQTEDDTAGGKSLLCEAVVMVMMFFALVFCFFVSKPFFQAPFFHFVLYTVPAQQSALLSELNMRSIQAAFPLRKFYTEKKFVLVSMNIFRLS